MYTIEERHMSPISRRSKRTPFRKNVLNDIGYDAKATWTVLLDGSFAMGASQ